MSPTAVHEEATKWGKATETSAARYSRTNKIQHHLGNGLTSMMGIKEGQHVLVASCGPGNDVFVIARIVGPSGRVVGFDLDKHSIKQAQKTLDEQHPDLKPYVELHICDVHDMSMFEGQTFDAIHCNSSYHWYTDKPRFLAQAARLARPGACIGIATQDRDFKSPMHDIREQVLTELGEDTKNFVFYPNVHELRRDLDAAGFDGVETRLFYGTYAHADALSLWNWLNDSSGNRWGNYLEEQKRERMRDMSLERFKGLSLPDGRPILQYKHVFAVAKYPSQ